MQFAAISKLSSIKFCRKIYELQRKSFHWRNLTIVTSIPKYFFALNFTYVANWPCMWYAGIILLLHILYMLYSEPALKIIKVYVVSTVRLEGKKNLLTCMLVTNHIVCVNCNRVFSSDCQTYRHISVSFLLQIHVQIYI